MRHNGDVHDTQGAFHKAQRGGNAFVYAKNADSALHNTGPNKIHQSNRGGGREHNSVLTSYNRVAVTEGRKKSEPRTWAAAHVVDAAVAGCGAAGVVAAVHAGDDLFGGGVRALLVVGRRVLRAAQRIAALGLALHGRKPEEGIRAPWGRGNGGRIQRTQASRARGTFFFFFFFFWGGGGGRGWVVGRVF